MSTTHVRAQRELVVAAPADIVFRMFTPKGEELWIDAWRPRYVHPQDGTTVHGMVFTTGDGAEHTVWQMIEFDPLGRRSVYARTTPGVRVGTVTVEVDALDPLTSQARIRYEMTALADGPVLAPYLDPDFGHLIDGWGTMIHARLPQLIDALA
jgi:hypothetical protein